MFTNTWKHILLGAIIGLFRIGFSNNLVIIASISILLLIEVYQFRKAFLVGYLYTRQKWADTIADFVSGVCATIIVLTVIQGILEKLC
jgi:hypothetical protein